MPANQRPTQRPAPRWAVARPARPAAELRLLCFPYAGGGSSIFRGWSALLDERVEVCPVLLPGREERFSEPPMTRMEELVPLLARNLAGWFDKPFALFGHSLGGGIAFALARYLCENGLPRPAHVFLSGCVPHPAKSRRHLLPDAGLLAEIRDMNGAPPEFLNNPELIELLLPMMRADFELAQSGLPEPGEMLALPVTAFAGTSDPEAAHHHVKEWAQHVSGPFESYELPGDHFFLHDAGPLLGIVDRVLSTVPGGRNAPGTR
ncbi:alpha/beta fold hydrolase [Streptomyces sp. MST-110588]|uniref:thioesterase II family protein n=1 Tax=Streptomyces sp. MST-110588 TaxID=2833628 RepID=UPI001F5DE373|nr:alpha/beta fold hydrolase [Streptomyces sp. MST-110588]UNO41470.1 thioesterase [Streptomyces sp. MST-110588]